MLATPKGLFVRAPFSSEAELEGVVMTHATNLFGSSIIYIPQKGIRTPGGAGTVPDAFVIQLENRSWYLVEAELAQHGTWEHIAPQVAKQLAAVATPVSLGRILEQALKMVQGSEELRDAFRELEIPDLSIHATLESILRTPPTIAIPIDSVPKDLKEWAQTLRTPVKIWVIEKFVSTENPEEVIYSLPDENLPSFLTVLTPGGAGTEVRATGSQPYQALIDADPTLVGQPVYMEYRPRGGSKQRFEGVLREAGVEIEGEVYSLSYGAVRCLQQARSDRRTANGWTSWRLSGGESLSAVYERLVQRS